MIANHTRIFKSLFVAFVVYILLKLITLHNFNFANVGRIRRESGNDELLVDKRQEPSLEQRLKLIREEMPSFPLEELLKRPQNPKDCAKSPDFLNIEFHNDYWQVAHSQNLTYYLFGAYFDNRDTMPEAPVVRLLTMINQYGSRNEVKYPPIYCQFWYKGRGEPKIVNVTDHKIIWIFGEAPRRVFPTLVSCPLPEPKNDEPQEVPEMVSLVSERCDQAKNLLRVVYEVDKRWGNDTAKIAPIKPQKAKQIKKVLKPHVKSDKPLRFAVCVKAMDFPYVDNSWRIVEWLELMRLLGASKVVFYEAQMHPNLTRVVEYYRKTSPDFVELRPLSLGHGQPNAKPNFHHYAMGSDALTRMLNNMIPYNDCFYRNMYNFDYIGVFDIDEVIMPLGNLTNWSELIELAYKAPDYQRESNKCNDWSSFCFRNVYFPRYPERPKVYEKLPSYYYMLQHVERVQEHCERFDAIKCLHSTRFVVGLHNHFPLFQAENGECEPKSVPIQYAQLNHYREPDNKTRLLNPVVDDNIWRFQPELQQRVYAKYEKLGFLPDTEQANAAKSER